MPTNAMKDDLTEFQSLLQSLSTEPLIPLGAHLTSDQLAAYHFQQFSAEQEEQIQEHLVTCRDCTLLLLDFAELAATEPEASKLSTQSETTAARLVSAPQIEATTTTTRSLWQRCTEWFFPRRLLPALAVLSLLLSLSLLAWVVSLKREQQTLQAQLRQQESLRTAATAQEIATLQQQKNEALTRAEQMTAQAEEARRALLTEQQKAHLNAPVIDVLPQEQRAAQSETAAEIVRTAPRFTLVIPATILEPKYPDYAIEILSKNGSVVVHEKGLRLSAGGSFTIALASQSFAAGEYRVTVYGLGRGARTRVAGGVIRVR